MLTARALALLAALAQPAPLASQEPPPVPIVERARAASLAAERARTALQALHARGSFPGASAALGLGDTFVAFAVGVAQRGEPRPLEPDGRMLAGSIGKTYVSAVALGLVLEGRLDLDRRAAEYLAGEAWLEGVPHGELFTLRQLMRHQSGLPRWVFDPDVWRVALEEPERPWTVAQRMAFVRGATPLFAPGEGWAYSDTNYVVVGAIVERVAGRPIEELVRERLLAPHGLLDTVPSDRRRIERLVQGHAVESRVFGVPERVLVDGELVFGPQFEWCGGGWATTPLDLARWARVLYTGRAHEGPYLELLLDAVPAPAMGPGRSYGLGAIVTETELGPLVGHDGFMPGYLSSMGYFPEYDLALAIQVNTDSRRAVGEPLHAVLVDLARAALEE